jgi:hypothetical protein
MLHCLGGVSHDYCDDLIRDSTICPEACPGTSIGISGDCRSALGARPDRVAPRVVAFPFLVGRIFAAVCAWLKS